MPVKAAEATEMMHITPPESGASSNDARMGASLVDDPVISNSMKVLAITDRREIDKMKVA